MGFHSLKLLHIPQSSKVKYKLPTMDKMQTSMTSYTASSLEILPYVHHAIFNLQFWAYVFFLPVSFSFPQQTKSNLPSMISLSLFPKGPDSL